MVLYIVCIKQDTVRFEHRDGHWSPTVQYGLSRRDPWYGRWSRKDPDEVVHVLERKQKFFFFFF